MSSKGRGRGYRGRQESYVSNNFSQGRGGRNRGSPSFNNQVAPRGRGFFCDMQEPSLPNPGFNSFRAQSYEEKRFDSPQPIFTPQPKLDYETQQFVDSLYRVWNIWKKSLNVSGMIQDYFLKVQNPYESAFKIAVTCPDFYQGKPTSLSVVVIEELAVFMNNNKVHYAQCLTRDMKLDVFETFTKQRNGLLTKLAFETYDLPADKNMFIDPIRKFISQHQYKEACQTATYLRLDGFHVEDFVIPLLFQDKLTIAEDYMKISRSAQLATAEYLDSILQGRISNQIDEIVRRLQIQDLKHEKLQYKPLTKMLTRFLKLFNIPASSCPNLNQNRREGALQFVIRKHYKYKEIEGECWREMALAAVEDDPYLEEELVTQIYLHGDIPEAAYFASVLQVPEDKLPYNVTVYLKSGNKLSDGESSSVKTEEEVRSKRVMKLPPEHPVTMVETDEGLRQCVTSVSRESVVGLDAEWKPTLNVEAESISLLQVSTQSETFLLDIPGTRSSPVWRDLSSVLFNNPEILKLGFGLATDMQKLKDGLGPLLSDTRVSGLGYLDLYLLWKKLMREYNVTMPYKGEESDSVEGLSKLVSLCLGVSLDKSEQFSNWDRRPLRELQKCYAALDSYCLLEVYRVLHTICTNSKVPFDDICQALMAANPNPRKSKKKPHTYKSSDKMKMPASPNLTPVRVEEIKMVCDTMLQGLGRQLRGVGIDTEILSNTQGHGVCVALAIEQNRVILTRGGVYNQLCGQVPIGKCYRVDKDNSRDQLVEVLSYFNVTVYKEDIFSRCQNCNGGVFKKLSPPELRKAIDSTQSHLPTPRRCEDDYDDEFDDYGGFSDASDDSYGAPVISSSSYIPSQSSEGRSQPCQSQEEEPFYGEYCLTSSGAHIKHESIPKEKFNTVTHFYICDKCGHCYWDGSHLEKVLGGKLKSLVVHN